MKPNRLLIQPTARLKFKLCEGGRVTGHQLGLFRSPKLCMVVGVMCAWLGIAASSAGAVIPQAYSFSFAGVADKALEAPSSVAVHASTGAVYVADTGNNRISKFDADGNFLFTFGAGVNQSTGGSVCTAASGDTCQPGSPGTAPGMFMDPGFVAVDNSGGPSDGSIYVGDRETLLVQKFDPNGELVTTWADGGQLDGSEDTENGPFSLAINGIAVRDDGALAVWTTDYVYFFNHMGELLNTHGGVIGTVVGLGLDFDSTGQYYYVDPGFAAGVRVNSPAGGEAKGTQFGPYTGVAIDRSTDDAYYSQASQIFQFVEPCTFGQCGASGAFGLGQLVDATDVGVDYRTHAVYSADTGADKIHKFVAPPPAAPDVVGQAVAEAHSRSIVLEAEINPNGRQTTYIVEYGAEDCEGSTCEATTEALAGAGYEVETVRVDIGGLKPDTDYHFRFVTENEVGTNAGPDRLFRTHPEPPGGVDPCPNALARKQTGAAGLLDCRAYELVSAPKAGGYDVASDLIPVHEPFGGYPEAEGRALYAIHNGGIPGAGNPTNRGPDPYLATRGENGWVTTYVGIPANINQLSPPFSSTLDEATAKLDGFAFSGPDICSPCFDTGIETGIPLRRSTGVLEQGMKGSLNPDSDASPAGTVAKRFSGDGSHFVFGSTHQFEPDGNNNGDVSIYDRNLITGTTQVVSKTPGGATMTGPGIAALDISADGSRILVGRLVSTDSAGNEYWDLFMHIGTSPNTVVVADTPSGALYNGMTRDGGSVFFTTSDQIADDSDSSADLFKASIGSLTTSVSRISAGIGGTGNSDSCNPTPNSDGNNWNAVGVASSDSCGTVALAGHAGVAPNTGVVYFLSPERLAGPQTGEDGAPNLYVAVPGDPPRYVATLESENQAVRNAVSKNGIRNTADFQVARHGAYAVFPSTARLDDELDNEGVQDVYIYDLARDKVSCVSCNPTGVLGVGGAGRLATNGLSLTDDGRVFFNTTKPIALRDLNGRQDVYEWRDGTLELVSTGTSTFDSSLLTVTSDGTDAFFWTSDVLDAKDQNGATIKLYTARENGGFFVLPPPQECKAADECHGPGSVQARTPYIGSVSGTPIGASAAAGCNALVARSRKAARRVTALRRRARRASGRKRATRLRRRARTASRSAKRLRTAAKECRQRTREAR